MLGGNGTIEEFSVLPRLYRDSIVYESWEGTHNVLVAQVLADLRRLPIVDVVAERLGGLLKANGSSTADRARAELDEALADARRAMADADFGARSFRRVLDRILAVARIAYLLDGDDEMAAEHVLHRRLLGAPTPDPVHAALVDRLASAPT